MSDYNNSIGNTRAQVVDGFWTTYQKLVRDVVIPYQWDALNDRIDEAEPSHAIENFRIAAGRQQGEHHGMVFQDSDVTKWIEAVAYQLSGAGDSTYEAIVDEVVELIGAAQQEDGYLNTYFTVKAPADRWSNLAECHELYCAGHLIEAAVAYYQATGKTALLEIARRLTDHIDHVFGPAPGQLRGYPGHPEIELALTRLYEVTNEERYLRLCRFFVEERGRTPHFYDEEYARRGHTFYWHSHGPAWMIKDRAYSQAHEPIVQQTKAVGHAVRLLYLYTGVAHLARLSNDTQQAAACHRIWDNLTQRQMYVTGGVGAQSHGEALASDYDLPSDTAYAESCASIALVMFARRMLELTPEARYADVMERALYNTVLAGMALDGRHFFYVNPLEVHPSDLAGNHLYDHVKAVRQRWFGCACCPPNIARILGALDQYIYLLRQDVLYVNLYIGSDLRFEVAGKTWHLQQRGNYPWQGKISFTLRGHESVSLTLALRMPDWCAAPEVWVNGERFESEASMLAGYLRVEREWSEGDRVDVILPMSPVRLRAHPAVRKLAGKVAVQRGPIVYCLEQADNGTELHQLALAQTAVFTEVDGQGALEGMVQLKTEGLRLATVDPEQPQSLYSQAAAPRPSAQTLTFTPYFAWANRGEGEMRVWVDER
ncbi:glycoside hydrolase family 127 protein [Pseudomonas asgharzadehiana]|uniref:Glycoside hydrolase family 127 protein n=1 Tax=Pseudomonas asgharzadehiana TaxID=2842349 RepID=A0ABX8P6B4_9PSED|nr:beta-L-arabinofuranosidase domain-containing protein [Pseudomonas asgharzadehiana]QXH69483.1 glycoside hydrolase family 127 protein [Pseudomonas asgharzadehiana]